MWKFIIVSIGIFLSWLEDLVICKEYEAYTCIAMGTVQNTIKFICSSLQIWGNDFVSVKSLYVIEFFKFLNPWMNFFWFPVKDLSRYSFCCQNWRVPLLNSVDQDWEDWPVASFILGLLFWGWKLFVAFLGLVFFDNKLLSLFSL